MAKLECDVCGGAIEIQQGGQIGICDSCGLKYSMDRIKEKVQEIRGTVKIEGAVETFTGNSEKERLLKNAEVLMNLGNISSAKETYEHIIDVYPEEVRAYVGKFYCEIELLPKTYSFKEYKSFALNRKNYEGTILIINDWKDMYYAHETNKFLTLYRGCTHSGIHDLYSCGDTFFTERMIKKLDSTTYVELIKEKCANFDILHEQYINDLISDIESGKIRLFINTINEYYQNHIPCLLLNYLDTLRREAELFESYLKKFNLFPYLSQMIEEQKHFYEKVDVDYPVLPKKIHKIEYFTPTEIVCKVWGYCGDAKHDMLVAFELGDNKNLEEARNKIISLCKVPYQQEMRADYRCQHCGGEFKGLFNKVCRVCGKPKDY